MGIVTIDYTPTPKQRMFHESIANEVLYGGAAGGGKSRALVQDAFTRCVLFPGFQAYMFRRTYPELENTLMNEARLVVPPEVATYNAARKMYTFWNGSRLYFRHCEHEKDRFNYYGAEIHGLYIDELTTFTRVIYDFLNSRKRAAKKLGIVPVTRCGSNPGSVGHGWVKGYFVTSAPYGQVHEVRTWSETLKKWVTSTLQYIPALVTENPHIGGDYVIELERKPEALRKALLHGSWDAFEGQVFVEFKDDPREYRSGEHTHVIAPRDIPSHWARYRSFDHGYTKPFCVHWYAVAPSGTAYLYREWYGSSGEDNVGITLTVAQIAIGIKEREQEEIQENVPVMGLADPSIFDASRGPSIAEQMRREGVVFHPADNSRMAGKNAVHTRLSFDKSGRPGLYVFSTCRALIRTLKNLPYSTMKNVEDIDTDAEDHAYDCLRYFCMGRAKPTPTATQNRTEPFDPFKEARR